MALKCGIVGLPNVGKSTLFNCLSNAKAQSANYPFCTIEPNVGVISVPDNRLIELERLVQPEKVQPTTIEIVDIAGLVRGASKGEGLGNKFLANIRETDAIIHVLRCFENDNIVHVDGSVDPIRDKETMEFAVAFAETGHLAVATLHANSANQALDRIINFFPEERKAQLLQDLSLNLKSVVSQRLLRRPDGKGRVAAIEILLNSPLVSDLIMKGEVHGLKEIMAKSSDLGMKTFDQALFELHEEKKINYEEAMKNADSQNELRLRIKLESKLSDDKDIMSQLGGLALKEKEDN